MADKGKIVVVGIGASAGGIGALEELLKALPADTGLAFVIIQHLDPSHRSRMAEVLRRHTSMNVVDALDQMRIEANTIYVPPSDKYMAIHDDTVKLIDLTDERIRLPIDFFFRSLAQTKADRAVGVVLSGSGADGSLGVREIRCGGGMVLAQEPASADFDAMPLNAINTGMVDFILHPKDMPDVLVGFAEKTLRRPEGQPPNDEEILDELSPILDLIASETNQDFHSYRRSTVYRRVLRRMGILRIDTFANYLDFLQNKPGEVLELAKDILVSVTSFFRDPESFEELRKTAIRPLIQEKTDYKPIRVWVPGCATGEEAFTIAILLVEEMAAAKKKLPVNIFATDLDADGLKLGRSGVYPESIALDLSSERLERFFSKTDHTYQVHKEIRELVTFAVQNLVSDPPFSKLDLISCRNVLIYFEPGLQRRIGRIFAFGLRSGGYLFLGKADATGGSGLKDEFTEISHKGRVYKRTGVPPPFVPPSAPSTTAETMYYPHRSAPRERRPSINFADLLNQAFLSRFGTSGIVTDGNGNIAYLAGQLRRFLDFPSGKSELNLFDMISDAALRRLRPALHRAFRGEEIIRVDRAEFSPGKSPCPAKVTIVPFTRGHEKLAAVLLEPLEQGSPTPSTASQDSESHEDASMINQLSSELKTLTEDFNVTVGDYETSAEELKAANEEITSINEELQSTNEELETSKEEIQAANEELSTVNNQLNLKIEELNRVNDDLNNFLNASEIAMLFVDEECRIKRFTPTAKKVFNFAQTDVGRPLGDISNSLVGFDAVAVCKTVLDTLAPNQQEIQDKDGNSYQVRCIPYRTTANRIEGVVLTLFDVTERKKAEQELKAINQVLEQRVTDRIGALRLLQVVTTSANEATTLEEALNSVLGQVCSFIEWPLGHAFLLDDSGKKLLSSRLWHSAGMNDFEIFRQITEKTTYALGEGSPGRVWAGGKPLWIPDLRQDRNIIRADSASEAGLRAALVIPVLANKEVVAVLEFFATNVVQPNQGLLEIAEQIGIQIGRVFERKRSEIQLKESERLAAIGTSTAKIAHEINNPLSNIYAAVQFLEHELQQGEQTDDKEVLEMLADVKREVDRLSRLMDDLRVFLATGRQPIHLQPVDIRSLILETTRLEDSALTGSNVRLLREIPDNLSQVPGDFDKLKQALLNLIRNAAEAMPEGGSLTLRAFQSGNNVVLEVTDTGVGISDTVNVLEHPVSSKQKGIGLGLLIVRQIIAEHHGNLTYTTKPGQGTTFRIMLPVQGS